MSCCSFKTYGKTYVVQPLYKCNTCADKYEDDEGICKYCSETCHKGHDLIQYMDVRFYCDCGTKYCCAE